MHLYPGWRAGVVALVGLLSCSCGRGGGKPPPPGGGVPAKVQPAIGGEVAVFSEYVGQVRSRDSAVIVSQVSAYVSSIMVHSGDHVRAGAPLLQLDPRRQSATFAGAQAAAASARAEVERARSLIGQAEAARDAKISALRLAEVEHARTTRLLADGAVSQSSFDQSKNALDAARADAESAESQIVAQQAQIASAKSAVQQATAAASSQKAELGYYRIVAPLDGVVGDIPVRVGDLVTPATRLTSVDRNDVLEAYVAVPAERAPELHPGQTVELYDSLDKKVATTRIFFVAPTVSEDSQTVLVKSRLEGAIAPEIKASGYYRARVIWSTKPGVRVPMTAITRVNGQPFAFVVDDGPHPVAHQRAVTLGAIENNLVVVDKGVNPGERVVVAGVQKLKDGVPVQPTE
ncbi:MAG: efflux RND transporter periplasmic adaptor subunit [Polyangiaceae bacterium]